MVRVYACSAACGWRPLRLPGVCCYRALEWACGCMHLVVPPRIAMPKPPCMSEHLVHAGRPCVPHVTERGCMSMEPTAWCPLLRHSCVDFPNRLQVEYGGLGGTWGPVTRVAVALRHRRTNCR